LPTSEGNGLALAMMARLFLVLGRLAGLLAALSAIALYAVLVFFNPYVSSPGQGGTDVTTHVVVALMVVLALTAAWASLYGRPLVLVLTFLLSFVPFGLYMLGTPGVFLWIGVADLLYLLAALLLAGANLSALGVRRGNE
jgi:hypothetical protein